MVVTNDRASELPMQADANNIAEDSLDCGIKSLGWCTGAKCQKLATLRMFVLVLSIAGILQGAVEVYFRISAKQAAIDYDYDPTLVDWLLACSGLFQALAALPIAFWAQRFHPIKWLGNLIIFQAIAAFLAIIPTLTFLSEEEKNTAAAYTSNVCEIASSPLSRTKEELPHTVTTLVMFFILQFAIGVGSAVYYVVGMSFMDDNGESVDSPAAIGAALAAKFWGAQFGSAVSLIVSATRLKWWLGWTILSPLLLVSGVVLTLFPRKLLKTVVQQAALRIIKSTSSHRIQNRVQSYLDDFGFLASIKRIIRTKILIFNLLGLMFIQTAMVNYVLQEQNYLQSRFYLPSSDENDLLEEWNSRFLSYFLKPPTVAILVLVAGLIIAKLRPSARTLVGWNIAVGTVVVLVYVSFIFLKCDVGNIAGVASGKVTQPYCSRQCICTNVKFAPVCPENGTQTFFSPCHAGCTTETNINNVALYEDCTCGPNSETFVNKIRATEGACNSSQCGKMWVAFQVLSVFAAAMLGTCVVGKIVITLRSALPQDKALALGLEMLMTGLFTYVPGKLSYDAISRSTCLYWSPGYANCLLRENPKHGNILNILTASLVLVGVLFDVLVFIFSKDLDCYTSEFDNYEYAVPLQTITPRSGTQYAPVSTDVDDASSRQGDTEPSHQAQTSPSNSIQRSPSSAGYSSIESNTSQEDRPNLTYAQIVFPPKDRTEPEIDFRLQSVREDEPHRNLESQDTRRRPNALSTFGTIPEMHEHTPYATIMKETGAQSPETDF